MSITKERIRELFTTMHLSRVTVGRELRRSERLAKKREEYNADLIKQIPTPYDVFFEDDTALAASAASVASASGASGASGAAGAAGAASAVSEFKTPARLPSIKGYQFTIISKQIYDMIPDDDPVQQDKLIESLKRDDFIIKRILGDIEDKPYNEIDGSEMGVYIESWICANLKCPGCNESSLYKYSHPNMPVIDVACVNTKHILNNGPRYYQIKATQNTSRNLYFTRTPVLHSPTGYIKVGSKRYGRFSHEVKVTDSDEDKELAIGYICISYKSNGNMQININPDMSFILIPQLFIKTQDPTASHHAYYKYFYTSNSVVISYNDKYIRALSLREYFSSLNINLDLLKNININYYFTYDEDDTTLQDVLQLPGITYEEDTGAAPPQTPLNSGPVKRSASVALGPPPSSPKQLVADEYENTFYKKYLLYKSKYVHLKLASLKIDY